MASDTSGEQDVVRDSAMVASVGVPILLKVEEAAYLLRLSRTKVYALVESGEIASIRCGVARRIPRAALDAWVAKQLAEG
jgi:excisionase family DNA binding protein